LGFVAFIFFFLHLTPWNFPGDPPLFDLLIWPAAVLTVGACLGWIVAKRWLTAWRPLVNIARTAAIASSRCL
jgi:hypothetical protein